MLSPRPRVRVRRVLPRALLLITVVALVGWLYFWWVGQKYPRWVMAGPSGYNGDYAQAILRGHLHLKDAPPEMARLPDPYDPAQYSPYYSFDLSYYNGRIYSYFGIVPPLLLFLPWKLVAGNYLTDQFGAGFFMTVGFALSLALLVAIRRRYLPDAPHWALALAIAVVALGNLSLLLFWPPYYCQVVQACARCLQLTALGAAFLALQPGRRPQLWLALASLSAGLMVATRPSFLPGAFLLVPVWLVLHLRASGSTPLPRRPTLPLLAAVTLPIAIVGLAQMGLNYARFDSVLEFGTSYQQFGIDLRDTVQFSPAYMPAHIWEHLFFVPKFLRYFPFIVYQEPPLGALIMLPFSWCFLLLPLGWRDRRDSHRPAPTRPKSDRTALAQPAPDRAAYRALALALMIAVVGNLVMLSGYYLALVRHQVDIVMPLTLAAACGLLAGAHAWRDHPWRRRALAVTATLLAAANISVSIAFATSYPHQAELPWLARIFNAPVYLWEKLRGEKFTDTLRLTLTFPAGSASAIESLLEVGKIKTDVVFVRYLDATRAVLGFFHTDLGAIESAPFPLLPGSPRTVDLTLGSLSPPATHPAFAGWPRPAIDRTHRRLLLRIDGHTLIDQAMQFHVATPGDHTVGRSSPTLAYPKFSGHIAQVTSLPLAPAAPRAIAWPAGAVQFAAVFANRRTGRSEPLLVSGTRTAGDLLWVSYLDETRLQLVLDHGLTGQNKSAPILLPDTTGAHRIVLRPEPATGRTVVFLDDVVVLTMPALPFPASADTVYFGIITFPAACEPVFGGRIDAISPPQPVH